MKIKIRYTKVVQCVLLDVEVPDTVTLDYESDIDFLIRENVTEELVTDVQIRAVRWVKVD